MELVFLQGAEVDIQAAYGFYGGPDAKHAELFLERLDKLSGLLRENPTMGPVYGGRFRRLVLRGFHHALFYTVTADRIFVSAVLDLRQNPKRVRQRLGLQ